MLGDDRDETTGETAVYGAQLIFFDVSFPLSLRETATCHAGSKDRVLFVCDIFHNECLLLSVHVNTFLCVLFSSLTVKSSVCLPAYLPTCPPVSFPGRVNWSGLASMLLQPVFCSSLDAALACMLL